jgi:hypothetical protein
MIHENIKKVLFNNKKIQAKRNNIHRMIFMKNIDWRDSDLERRGFILKVNRRKIKSLTTLTKQSTKMKMRT